MKVICIKEMIQIGSMPTPSPEVGSEYNIVLRFKHKGRELCELAEFPRRDGYVFAYDAEAFAPLNGPDMAERDEAYQRQQLAAEGKLLEGVAAILAEEETMPQDAWERNWAAIVERLNAGR